MSRRRDILMAGEAPSTLCPKILRARGSSMT
jgi:hypothetical protein